VNIDSMLDASGWVVQNTNAVNLAASRGVAVREFIMRPPHFATSP
jgi:type I restriction enzyme R subunit